MAQKVLITAVDQRGGRSDKGDDRGAQSRCLPRLSANARLSVDGDGNLTISRVVGVSVGGLNDRRLRIGIGVGEDQILNAVSGVTDTIYPLWSADGISKIYR